MKLTLRLADAATQNGQSRTLTEGRLCIGRGADNDWVLADPDRTLSKNHCRIDGSESGFMLTDLSTNGVFLAGQGQAIGRGHSCALEDGDSFSLGPHTITASIEGGDADALQLEHGLGLPQEDEEAIFPSSRPRADGASPIAPAIAEPWLTDIPGGGFGPDRRAAPQGWDAPPDPATYAASGVFEASDPLDPRQPGGFAAGDAFSQVSEHLPAASTVMRLPQPQIVLPTDWNEVPVEPPAAEAAMLTEAPHPAAVWPPALPTEPEPPRAVSLPPAWLTETTDEDWEQPAPPAALPASWAVPEPEPDLPVPIHPLLANPVLAPAPEPRSIPAPEARVVPAPEARVIPAPEARVVAVPEVRPLPAPQARAMPAVESHMLPQPRPALQQPPIAAAQPAAEILPAGPPDFVETAPVSAGEAAGRLVAAFLQGAGLPPDTLRGADTEASFREIGQMVRAAVDGVRDILATRALVKSEFRVDQTVLRRSDNNAMKFAPDAERCLAAMVGTAPPGFLPGPEAMRQSMDDIKRHELALVAAINKVFADLGRQLDPEQIMAKARQETGLGTRLPFAKEVRCWSIYTETHALLQDSGAANTGGSLLAPVAHAYDLQLRRGGK